MKAKSVKKRKIFIIVYLLLFTIIIGTVGCDDSGVVPVPPRFIDTNVVVYKDIFVFFWDSQDYDTTYAGVDIWAGMSVRQDSTNKDMELTDSAGTLRNYYFRSGDLTLLLTGKKTRFKREYGSLVPIYFDTLSVIKDSDSLLTPSDFTEDSTAAWEYFNLNQNRMPVFSFYLQGRNTGNNYIYGVFHVKGVQRVFSSNFITYGIMVIIDIKLNKAGKNQFRYSSP